MFQKKDYRAFFNELMALELEMEKNMKAIAKKTTDENIKKIYLKIASDEVRHQGIVKEMHKILNS